MAERKSIITKPPTTGDFEHPTGPNGMLTDFVLGALGDQQPGSGASAVGSLATLLPIEKLLKMLPGLKAATGLRQVAPGIESAASSANKVLRRDVPQWNPMAKLVEETEARKLRGGPGGMAEFAPKPQTGTLADLPREEIDKALELTSVPESIAPRNRGSVDPPHDGTLPKHREVVPAYRAKSGMALDTLNDLEASRGSNGTANQLENFEDYLDGKPGGAPGGFGGHHGYEGPSGLHNSQADQTIRNPARFDPASPFSLSEDPVQYTARLKGIDDTAMSMTREEKDLAEALGFGKVQHPHMIDTLIQSLSDYFTTPKFDPFKPRK